MTHREPWRVSTKNGLDSLMKFRTATRACGVNSVDHHRVEVHIRIESVPKTLHKRHGATLRGIQTQPLLSPSPKFSKQSAYENVQDIAGEASIIGQAVTQRERQRQDPLPYPHDWKDTIDQMSRRIRHASSTTGRTPDSRFTRKGQQPVLTTVLTVKPQKTPRENAAIQEGSELFFNESGDRPVALLLSAEESFQLFRDDLIQHCRFRIARAVCDADSHEGVASSTPARNARRNILSNMRG